MTETLERPVDVGTIFTCSWGYDQTNIDYYAVTRRTDASVWIVNIGQSLVPGSEGFMSEHVLPDPANVIPWGYAPCGGCEGHGYVHRDGTPSDQWQMSHDPDTFRCDVCNGNGRGTPDVTPRRKRLQSFDSSISRGSRWYLTMTSYSTAFVWEGGSSYQSHYA